MRVKHKKREVQWSAVGGVASDLRCLQLAVEGVQFFRELDAHFVSPELKRWREQPLLDGERLRVDVQRLHLLEAHQRSLLSDGGQFRQHRVANFLKSTSEQQYEQ